MEKATYTCSKCGDSFESYAPLFAPNFGCRVQGCDGTAKPNIDIPLTGIKIKDVKSANKRSAVLTLFDNEKNRKKSDIMGQLEIMADDEDNHGAPQEFWNDLDDFIKWGGTYKLTIEEI